ncbi:MULTISPECIES: hypothetical protein [Vagococcus]|uniref:hypothetical protein n=1 Tax=Vagococcus TaxID=2737 RepID=UPI002FC7057E
MKKWKELSFEQKSKRAFILIAGIIFLLLVRFNWSLSNFFIYVFIMSSVYPSKNYYQNKRLEEIKYMWELVDTLKVTHATLSQVTNIGTIDLEATKFEGNGVYLPPRKNILKGIEYLENLQIQS